ncbi:hypothetical protein BS17DRAFT_780058 [Gyrodon lividus]|nr:hypothetical protein BS17DRAFT_780058 [Gyrodon lividus]
MPNRPMAKGLLNPNSNITFTSCADQLLMLQRIPEVTSRCIVRSCQWASRCTVQQISGSRSSASTRNKTIIIMKLGAPRTAHRVAERKKVKLVCVSMTAPPIESYYTM